MSEADPLSPEVRRLFASLTHAGGISQVSIQGEPGEEPRGVRVAQGEAGKQAHGTWVRFALRRVGPRVAQVRYQAYGCPHTLAVCEWLARELEAGRIASLSGAQHWSQVLGVPITKLGRLLVVEDALRATFEAAGLPVSGFG
jgi:hypothetical protein